MCTVYDRYVARARLKMSESVYSYRKSPLTLDENATVLFATGKYILKVCQNVIICDFLYMPYMLHQKEEK
jgi:hypothetical protein